jgi:hypothetical protein
LRTLSRSRNWRARFAPSFSRHGTRPGSTAASRLYLRRRRVGPCQPRASRWCDA